MVNYFVQITHLESGWAMIPVKIFWIQACLSILWLETDYSFISIISQRQRRKEILTFFNLKSMPIMGKRRLIINSYARRTDLRIWKLRQTLRQKGRHLDESEQSLQTKGTVQPFSSSSQAQEQGTDTQFTHAQAPWCIGCPRCH